MIPLRRLLAASLVLLASVPAVLVAWVLVREANASVEELAGRLLTQVAALVQAGTEQQLRQAHEVLNGVFPARLSAAETERARAWLREPARFEAIAFVLARHSAEIPALHFANLRGEYFGVQAEPQGMKVGIRGPGGAGRAFYLAREPGDRSRGLAAESASFEPRTSVWYAGAMEAKDRVFSPVRVSPERRQLVVSLSQPVYDEDGGAAGVFAADLYLQRLSDVLRTQRISAHGGAFIIDEKGALVASSAGDPLFAQAQGRFERRSPRDSANPAIRAGFAGLEALRAHRAADSVQSDTRLQR
ncbi:MAG TPA: cache domain-containing protein, partial [Ramlibacter sp.]|nr:cache domain-containing protein [Ramlibacter sp.]